MTDQRFPVNVRIIGVMHREKDKMFMASVLWSDESEVVVYRSLLDFKTFHRQLKKKFAVENPRNKEDRVLPRLKANAMKRNFQRKGPSKSMYRIKGLESYCTKLLQCDVSVIQSSEVIQFFQPNEQELNPDFAKNTVMILPAEDPSNCQGEGNMHSKHLSMGNVTQPFVSKAYRCLAPYETKDLKNRPFKVMKDENLDVLFKDQAGWWLVENSDKHLAWFPAPYLEVCKEDKEEEENECDTVAIEGSLHCASRSYSAKKTDEISVHIGTVVEVMQKSDDGWWLVRYNGRIGLLPSIYLQPYYSPAFGLQTCQRKVRSSTLNLSSSAPERPSELLSMQHRLQTFRSLEVLSDPQRLSPQELNIRKNSLSSDSSFSSSLAGSLVYSLSGSEGDEEIRSVSHQNRADSGLATGQPSPTESSSPVFVPKVPPRPHAQEILTRCSTYTRKAALASRARLFPENIVINAH